MTEHLHNYGIAAAAGILAVLARWLLDPWLGNYMAFTFALGATIFAVWWGGYRPAVMVMIAAYIASDYLFAQPRGTIVPADLAAVFTLISYSILGILIIAFGQAMRKGREARARLAAIVDSSDDAIVSKSLEGVITSWNKGAERIFGYPSAEAVGKSINLIIPPERRDEERTILHMLRLGQRIEHFETERISKDGGRIDISLTVSPVLGESGRIIGASKIARDISERKQAERHKDEFLAVLAHELRNPLAPIRNSLEIMKVSSNDADLLARIRDMMDRQVTHMERLIDDLLDISRISRNKLELRKVTLELAPVIHQALEDIRPLAASYGHKLTVSVPDGPIMLSGDPVRLAQIFGNLLNNACKYTPPGGEIGISAERAQDEVAVSVKDNGNGIPPGLLPRVFELFTQAEQQTSRASQTGLGIGLSLVQRLVEMHGGRVEGRSEGEGMGSEFIVTLPVLAGVPVVDPDSAPPADASGGEKSRVLVVDDKRDNADSLAAMLGVAGYRVRIAYDGPGCIALAESYLPDVVMLDLGMPGMDGFETCRRLRRQPWGDAMLIIALTGWGREADRRRTNESGFDGHLVKPVTLAAIDDLLASLDQPAATIDLRPVTDRGVRVNKNGQRP